MAAAIQAKRMDKTAIIVEPGNHLGGMTSGGLGATDIGNKAAIGGIAREFYHRVALHYAREDAWQFERPSDFFKDRNERDSLEDGRGLQLEIQCLPNPFGIQVLVPR